jgi:Na+-transporting NADH:ubiquinone oxidoreductase subunit A
VSQSKVEAEAIRSSVSNGVAGSRAAGFAGENIETLITDQSALFAGPEDDLRVDALVAEGDRVAQGQPVLRSRRHPELVEVAPVAGTIASVDIAPGRRLSSIVFFYESDAGRHVHAEAALSNDPASVRQALQGGGLWSLLRSRPFGRVPKPAEKPAAIFVMAADSRPHAPSPALAIEGREEELSRGLAALALLTDGPIYLCHDSHVPPPFSKRSAQRVKMAAIKSVHPHGLAGFQIAMRMPATLAAPVWDVHAEDVVCIGSYLVSGLVPETRLVTVSGPALREERLVRCQPGADLRALCFDILKPGPHRLLGGSAHDGREARWLGPWQRQVTALLGRSEDRRQHWFSKALKGASRPLPIIPTAALDHAFAGILPATPLARAIASNDAETAIRLGALSLVEDDLALADFVTAASPRLSSMFRALIDRIAMEEGA